MTFGNRLYLSRAKGGFEQTALNDSMPARVGRGGAARLISTTTAFQMYVANGMESKQSVRITSLGRRTTLWTKRATTSPRPGISWEVQSHSWAGLVLWRLKNRLYLNQRGESFVEIGHLAGVALEPDSHNVVAEDLDGDGRVDLLVTTLKSGRSQADLGGL
jgi:hypothetical protein